jgi:hypothetical protein
LGREQTLMKVCRAYYRLPIVAYITILLKIVEAKSRQEIKENMPYLIMASGWHGRLALSLGWGFGFNELMDLSQAVQVIWKSAQNASLR